MTDRRFPPPKALPPSHLQRQMYPAGSALEVFQTLVVQDSAQIGGTLTIVGQIISAVPTGTAPFTAESTTKVTNLNADLLDDQSGSYYLDPFNMTGFGVAGGYLRSTGAAWARVSGLDATDLTGTIPPARLTGAYSGITGVGTLASGAVPASLVTAGTFGGASTYTFPANLVATGTLTVSGIAIQFGSNTGASAVHVYNTAATNLKGIRLQNASVNTWGLFATGTNDPFLLRAYDNTGAQIDDPLTITRAAGGTIAFSAARPITGGTYNGQTISSAASFTGTLTVATNLTASGTLHTFGSNAGAGLTAILNGAAGQDRGILVRSAGVSRWFIYGHNTAESGADAGTPLRIAAYTDAGVFIDNVLSITRAANGTIAFASGRPVTMGSSLAITGALSGVTTLAISDDVTYSDTAWALKANTADASDTRAAFFCGGGSAATSRGAYVGVYGNENVSLPGQLSLVAGSTGSIVMTGAISISSQLTSTLATGTAPFAVTSTTVNTNLNADLLDGQHGSYYLDLANATGTLDETLGGTGLTSYTLGDLLYASGSNTLSKLAGNTSATGMYLKQTGNGTISAAPVWDTLTAADVAAGTFPGASYTMSELVIDTFGTLGFQSGGAIRFHGSWSVVPLDGASTTTILGSNGAKTGSLRLSGEFSAGGGAHMDLYGTSHANAGRVDLVSGGSADLNLTAGSGVVKVTTDLQVASGKVYKVNGTQVVAARITGYTNAMTGTADRATAYATSTITLQQLAERVKALEDDLTTHGLIGV